MGEVRVRSSRSVRGVDTAIMHQVSPVKRGKETRSDCFGKGPVREPRQRPVRVRRRKRVGAVI